MRTVAKIERMTDKSPNIVVANDNVHYGAASAIDARRAQYLRYKRLFDIVISLAALLVLAPVLILIAAIVALERQGAPIFSQVRWGRGGRKFRAYRFCSLRRKRDGSTGIAQTPQGDPGLTKVGSFLARTNLDELPKLINVLIGDMSVVGPRCHVVGIYAASIPYAQSGKDYRERHAMRPGLMGLAQMHGLTDRPSREWARIRADLYYVEHFTIWLDLKILSRTILSEFRNGRRS